MSVSRLDARERRTILLGLVTSVCAVTITFAIIPFVRHWHAREQLIAAELDRLQRLRTIMQHEPALHKAVRTLTTELESGPQRLLAGRTPALAASTLQAQLQEYAEQSRVTVSRLDVAGAPAAQDSTVPRIPATVSALGDVYGITELLSAIQHGGLLLEITELAVRPNPALHGNPLQITVTLHGAYPGS